MLGGKQNVPERECMATQPSVQLDQAHTSASLRAEMVQSLAGFRKEWEEASKGESLLDVRASVGLLLADVLEKLALNQRERSAVLGVHLCREIEIALSDQPLGQQ